MDGVPRREYGLRISETGARHGSRCTYQLSGALIRRLSIGEAKVNVAAAVSNGPEVPFVDINDRQFESFSWGSILHDSDCKPVSCVD